MCIFVSVKYNVFKFYELEEKLQSLIAVDTSAGNRQPKTIIDIHPKTGEIH